MIKTIFAVGLFILSGGLSAYVYQDDNTDGGIGVLMPGIIYVSATILVFFFLDIKQSGENIIAYIFSMIFTYYVIFYATYITLWQAYFWGIFTCGFGALISFALADRFIKRIKFDKIVVFLIGAFSFAINDILNISGVANFLKPIFNIKRDELTMFSGSFLFWQSLVGAKLYLAVRPIS